MADRDEEIENVINDYHTLFTSINPSKVDINENQEAVSPHISSQMNEDLLRPCTKEEVSHL